MTKGKGIFEDEAMAMGLFASILGIAMHIFMHLRTWNQLITGDIRPTQLTVMYNEWWSNLFANFGIVTQEGIQNAYIFSIVVLPFVLIYLFVRFVKPRLVD